MLRGIASPFAREFPCDFRMDFLGSSRAHTGYLLTRCHRDVQAGTPCVIYFPAAWTFDAGRTTRFPSESRSSTSSFFSESNRTIRASKDPRPWR